VRCRYRNPISRRKSRKTPYNFDFLTLGKEAHERDLERGLLDHLRQFLLELGVGFAFVGSQYRLTVGNENFFIDVLFYHLKLRICGRGSENEGIRA
jgi:predicted nuclease of restriction endonuclease-like (RecB) superfamily